MPTRPRSTPDDLFIYIYKTGQVRSKDLEKAFVATKQMSRGTLYKYKRLLVNAGKIQSTPVFARPPYYVYSVPEKYHPEAELLIQYKIFPQNTFRHFDAIPWTDPPEGFYLTHVKEKILWRNERTGAIMMLTKTPVGISTPIHFHPYANQWNVGYYGEVETLGGKRQNLEGTISFVPKGELHGTGKVTKETLFLVYFDGPRTKKFVDEAKNTRA